MLTQYLLNNVRRICKSDYKPTPNDIEMINKFYPKPQSVKFGRHKQLYEFYSCELNPSKYAHFNKVNSICNILFIVDLTSYHRTIINPNTNSQINEMLFILNEFEKMCNIRYRLNMLFNFHFFFL